MAKEKTPVALQVKLIKLSELSPDPANLRKHPKRNLEGIAASLKRFGQQKPIVVDKNGIVVAGNGTFLAAKKLGWASIAAIKTELEGAEAIAYAIADNQMATMAEWDEEALAKTLNSLDLDLQEAAGFIQSDIEELLGKVMEGGAGETSVEIQGVHEVAVSCEDERDQRELYGRMKSEGRKCRVVTI